MSIIYLLIPLSIVTAAVFLGGFIWAVRSGQYEDTCTPSMRLLAEDSDTTAAEGKRAGGQDEHIGASGGERGAQAGQILKSE